MISGLGKLDRRLYGNSFGQWISAFKWVGIRWLKKTPQRLPVFIEILKKKQIGLLDHNTETDTACCDVAGV